MGFPHAVVLVADVTLNPDPAKLPGGSVLQQLTNGLGGWALVLALAGLVIGAAAWALGAHSQNYNQSVTGRRAVLVSGLAALLIGAAPALVNFFFHAGQSVR
jgi:MFS family permease